MDQLKEKEVEELKKVKAMFQLTGEAFWKAALQMQEKIGEAKPTNKMKEKLDISEANLDEMKWYRLSPKDKRAEKKVMYIHGGAYFMGLSLPQLEWCEKIAEDTGAEIWVPCYPLAPQNTCEKAINVLVKLYHQMIEEVSAENIIFIGDSAGGGLILSLAMAIREEGLPQPKDLIMISPCTNICFAENNEDKDYLEQLEKCDPILSKESMDTLCDKWRGNIEKTDYRVSPGKNSLKNLGRMTLFTGTADILNLNARQLQKAAKKQNVPLRYWEKENKLHCWLIIETSSAKEENDLIKQIILS